VALQLQLHGQRDRHSWILTSDVLNLVDSDFCKQYLFKLSYWLLSQICLVMCFLVIWSLIYSFLNLFWRSKIRQSGLVKWYFENIKYIDIMWYISKYHDILKISWYFRYFNILIFLKISWYFHTLVSELQCIPVCISPWPLTDTALLCLVNCI